MAFVWPRLRLVPDARLVLVGALAVFAGLPFTAGLHQVLPRPVSLPALIAAFGFGPWAGLAVAAAGALPTLAWKVALFSAAEAVITGYGFRRWRHPAGAALAFWIPCGLPALLTWPELAGFPGAERWLAAGAGFTSGMLTAIVASFLARLPRDHQPPEPLRNSVFTAILMSCCLVTLLVTLTHNSMFRREAEAELERQLQSQAILAGRSLEGYIQLHQASIESLAQAMGQIDQHRPEPLQHLLESHQSNFPGFLTMLVADSTGAIRAAAPAARFARHAGTYSVADRAYFRAPMATGEPFVSGVFRGRGFGTDPIVAVSTPLRGRDGRTVGVVEGSLNLRAMRALEPPGDQANRIRLLILDATHRVIYASEGHALTNLDDASHSPVLAAAVRSRSNAFQYVSGAGEPWMGAAIHTPSLDWHLIVQRPLSGLEVRIARHQAIALLLVGAVLLAALLLADYIGRRFASPLEMLALQVSVFEPENEPRTLTIRGSASSEVAALIRHWNRLAPRLHENYEALRAQMAEIEAARQSARAADHAKTRFLATVTHELRTPLNGIIGMSELLLRANLSPDELEQARTMRDSANALLRIIDDILQMAHLEEGTVELRPAPFRLLQVVEEVHGLLGALARDKGLEFRVTMAPGVPGWVDGDAARLRQILVCLAGNAIKFTRAGSVELALEPVGGPTVRFRVRDTGVGIPPDRRETLFQPFSQADNTNSRQFGGTGLGLAIAKRLVELMGGRIHLESEPGRGTTVTFSLPFGQSDPRTEPAPALELLQQQQEVRVLVAEDHSVNRLVARRLLEKLGYRVDLAEDGLAAVEACRRQPYAAVLMDCQMPRMDGFAATALIRQEHPEPHIPILAMTANALPGDREKCLEAGMDDYMAKPLELAAMSAMLERWIRR